MPEPASTFVSAEWLKPLWKKLQSIRGERAEVLKAIRNEFNDPEELARYYVEPKCQHHNPADHREDEEPRTQVRAPIFETISRFLEGDYAVVGGGRNQMFVLSDAGMGKTSLLVMLRLTHLMSFWPKDHDCHLLKLGPDTVERLQKVPDPSRTVLLLDALDEDRSAWGRIDEHLLELLNQTQKFRRVILSCRTQFFPEVAADPFKNPGRVEIGGFVCPMLYLALFDDRQVEQYLEKRYPDRWMGWFGGNTKRVKAHALVEKMRDLRCRPMLLAHVEDLVGSELAEWSEYAVYGAMLKAWLDREERRLRQQGHGSITAEALERASIRLASHLQQRGVRFASEAELESLLSESPEVEHLRKIHFGGRSLLNRNAEGAYRFSHFSIQEYLVARQLLAKSTGAGRLEIPPQATEKVVRFLLEGRRTVPPALPISFPGGNLARFQLAGENLAGADLRGANLAGANLRGCNLAGADLSGADLSSADLSEAQLQDAKLDQAKLEGVYQTTPLEGLPFTLNLRPNLPLHLAWIPPGSFLRGDSDEEAGGSKTKVVLTRGFWMGVFPITQEQFQDVLGKNPSAFTKAGPSAPVENVRWNSAVDFCRRLKASLAGVLPAQFDLRLPTEAEWEYACRAGSKSVYCFGDDPKELGKYAWFDQNSNHTTHPVGQKQANAWGLFDMHGNVWEWCADWYGQYPNTEEPLVDPQGPEVGVLRVLRGGSWYDSAAYCRSSFRSDFHPSIWFQNIGFRVVLAPSSVPSQAGKRSGA